MTNIQADAVKRLRYEELGYKRIASRLGLSPNTIKAFCRREGLTDVSNSQTYDGIFHSCKQCGAVVEQTPGYKEKKFCADKCRMLWWNSHLDRVKRKAFYQIECKNCHKVFMIYGDRNRKYCSHKCYIEFRYGRKRDDECTS